MKKYQRNAFLKIGDFGVAVPALAAVILSFFLVYSAGNTNATVNIKGENGEWVFPVNSTETVLVRGPLGDTVIEIRNGAARITASPCSGQTCITAGAVYAPGQWAACLPNRVMLYIDKDNNETGIDATTW